MALSSSMPTAANQASFRKLLMVAFCIAMMGLFGNLVHLHSLTTKFKNDPSDLITHYIMTDEHDVGAAKAKQQPTPEQLQRRATLEEDSANSNSINHGGAIQSEQQQQQQQQPATITLLRGLLRESINSLEACRRAHVASLSVARNTVDGAQHTSHKNNAVNNGGGRRNLLEDTSRRRTLARFGWLNTLTNYLATSSLDTAQTIQQQRQHEECTIPSSHPACQVQNMTMLVLSEGSDLRCLFVNLLSWILYSSVSDIHVLLPGDVSSTLTQNIKYGRRILDWHDDPYHKVHLIPYNQSLWDGVRSYQRSLTATKTTTKQSTQHASAAVVFMNGDVRWKGNDDGLQAGLALWQRHPASVVASSLATRRLRVHPTLPQHPPAAPISESKEGRNLPFCKHQALQHDNETTIMWSRRRLDDENGIDGDATDVAATDTQRRSKETEPKDDRPSVSILDMSGLIIHRDYLCLLAHHHVVKPLIHFASSFEEAKVAMSILLTLASSGSSGVPTAGAMVAPLLPSLYPLRVIRLNVTTTVNRTMAPPAASDSTSSLDEDNVSAINRSGRLRSSASNQRMLVEANAEERRRGGAVSLDDTTITNIMGYFGSLPPTPKSWCTIGPDPARCSLLRESEEALPNDLNWLIPGNTEHHMCPSRV